MKKTFGLKNTFFFTVSVVVASLALGMLFKSHFNFDWLKNQAQGPDVVLENYGSEIEEVASNLGMNKYYFMALCMLECGGRKPAPTRFEKHVFKRLRRVKEGEHEKYELIETKDLAMANEEALKNLASSWGPFQIMGYKVIPEGYKVKDLRGAKGIYFGMKWIVKEYGDILKKENYRNAFHYHNTGSIIKNGRIRTYNPNYVREGEKWMKYFKDLDAAKQ